MTIMARKYANGPILWTLEKDALLFNIHANGHILQRRATGGYRQWAIVPLWGIGNVVDWLIDAGFEVVA
jgi:hypothetical protein